MSSGPYLSISSSNTGRDEMTFSSETQPGFSQPAVHFCYASSAPEINGHRTIEILVCPSTMTSLKRSFAADAKNQSLSSKVYIRSTKSGKVQKIVRELYLRQDIPCSSRLCTTCLSIVPADYHKRGHIISIKIMTKALLTFLSCSVRTLRDAGWNQGFSEWPLLGTGHECIHYWNGPI